MLNVPSCFESNLNGEYHSNPVDNGYYQGLIWELWRGDYSLKSSKMMVRPKQLAAPNNVIKSHTSDNNSLGNEMTPSINN